MSLSKVESIRLANGLELPAVGLGTYLSTGGDITDAIYAAIDNGYRLIDTAYFYANEEEIGAALNKKIQEGAVKREELFVLTKLWNSYHEPPYVEVACRKSLDNLNLGPLDMYMLHWPIAHEYVSMEQKRDILMPVDTEGKLRSTDFDYLDTWKEMEKLVDKGLVKTLGVSNFNSEQLTRLLNSCRIKPLVNQVECNPLINQEKLNSFCKQHDIVLMGYSPLARPHYSHADPSLPKPVIEDPAVIEIANKYNKNPGQIVLRYLVNLGVIVIPKSTNPQRIKSNIEIFDFNLNENEMITMKSFNRNYRMVPFPLAVDHKYYPFKIEY